MRNKGVKNIPHPSKRNIYGKSHEHPRHRRHFRNRLTTFNRLVHQVGVDGGIYR